MALWFWQLMLVEVRVMRVVSLLSIIGVGSYWFVVELLALVDFLFLVSDLGGGPLVEDGFYWGPSWFGLVWWWRSLPFDFDL